MFGQAVAGILSSLLSIACQGLTSNALLHGRFFFMIATVWSMFSILIHEYLIKSDGINALTIQTTDLIDTTPTQRLLGELFTCFTIGDDLYFPFFYLLRHFANNY